MYKLHYGIDDTTLYVCHRCNHPYCCNPEHLYLGTPSQNIKDGYADGLFCVQGEKNGFSKLTTENVVKIKELPFPNVKELAKEFDVKPHAIYKILEGKTWRHVE